MKIKNKTRFRVLCALYVIGYLFFCILGGMNSGMMISDSPALAFAAIYYGLPVGVRNLSVSMFVWIILSFFLVLAILWQTNLSKQKLNRTALLCLGGNMLLTCLSRGIVEWLVSGVAEGLFTMLVILASLLVMVGSGIGMAYLVQKKNGALDTYEAFSDIMTEEEFEKWNASGMERYVQQPDRFFAQCSTQRIFFNDDSLCDPCI